MAFSISLHNSPLLPTPKFRNNPKLSEHSTSSLMRLARTIRKRHVASASEDKRPAIDEYPERVISGEWPENFSLLSYNDFLAYLESQIVTNEEMKPTALLGDVMSRPVQVAMAEQKLDEIRKHFDVISGLPVIDSNGNCIGVISKKDIEKATNGKESTVGQLMSSPPITLSPKKTVLDAAALMLKMKIHRIPIVNELRQVIGIVTRTDVFRALEGAKP